MEKYRVGIIGCGRMGRGSIEDEVLEGSGMTILPYSHAGAVRDLPKLELVAGADVSSDALADFSRRWGVKSTYRDFGDMLKKENLDIVCIATSTRVHYDAVMQSVDAGIKGIFCEKPISTTLEEA